MNSKTGQWAIPMGDKVVHIVATAYPTVRPAARNGLGRLTCQTSTSSYRPLDRSYPSEAAVMTYYDCRKCLAYWDALEAEMSASPAPVGGGSQAVATDAVAFARAFLAEHDRKATDDDMTAVLVEAVTSWALDYQGDFSFLVDMQRAAFQSRHYNKDLRPAQARGAFNCLLAEVKRQQAASAPVAVQGTTPIVDGYYTVVLTSQSNHVTLRLRTAKSGKYQHVSVLGWHGYTSFGGLYGTSFRFWSMTKRGEGMEYPLIPSEWSRQRQALDVLLQSDDAARVAMGQAYALESGQCFRCAALLTDPPSIALGLGPTCKGYYGF